MTIPKGILKPGRVFLNPATDDTSIVKVGLDFLESGAFTGDKPFEDVDGFFPNAGKFSTGNVGYPNIVSGNRLGLHAFKRNFIVESFSFVGLTGVSLKKVSLDGTAAAISSYPALILAGEDIEVVGTAPANADNYIAIAMRSDRKEGL